MKIGYPCANLAIGCSASRTFRLASYSENRMKETIGENLGCIVKILRFNVKNGLFFFRISSDTIPFASHPVCRFDWQMYFRKELQEIGHFIEKNRIRISMHPDQFVLINALKEDIIERSINELEYHSDLLDSMNMNKTAKIQIHVGGVYGDKKSAIKRFVENYRKLPVKIRRRLVIENDERLYSLKDCISISRMTGVPVLFDVFHHSCNNNGEPVMEALAAAKRTWKKHDGKIMVDYSTQQPGRRFGSHAQSLDHRAFKKFLEETRGIDFDVMLEIKDKENSAIQALEITKKQKLKNRSQ